MSEKVRTFVLNNNLMIHPTLKHVVSSKINKIIMNKKQEDNIGDFFNTLKSNNCEETTAYVYYASPLKMNKTYLNENSKQQNPIVDKVIKYKTIKFNYGDTFKDAVLKINPDYEFKGQRAIYEKVDGSDILTIGKNGLYLPILPLSSESSYKLKFNDEIMFTIKYEEIKKFIPEIKERKSDVPIFNQLLVSRISKIESDINFWINYDFEYKNV